MHETDNAPCRPTQPLPAVNDAERRPAHAALPVSWIASTDDIIWEVRRQRVLRTYADRAVRRPVSEFSVGDRLVSRFRFYRWARRTQNRFALDAWWERLWADLRDWIDNYPPMIPYEDWMHG